MTDAWATERLKVFVDFKVGRIKQEDAIGRMAIAPGTSNLLNVLLKGTRGLVMQNVTNVRFVDAHAKGGCCDHDQTPRRHHELTLCCLPIGSPHLAVIAGDWDTGARQSATNLIDRGGRCAIDDSRPRQALDAPGRGRELA
jgi:hypothetical protein